MSVFIVYKKVIYLCLGILLLSGCGLIGSYIRGEGHSISLPLTSAYRSTDTFGRDILQLVTESTYNGSKKGWPPPQEPNSHTSQSDSFPGFAVFEPIDKPKNLWHLTSIIGINNDPQKSASTLIMPDNLYQYPTRIGIATYIDLHSDKIIITNEDIEPDKKTIDILSKYSCSEIAVIVFVSKNGQPYFENLETLVGNSHSRGCRKQ